ncbi:hypothetical protein ACO1MN_14655, partial [Staphylococcus aureus]
ASAGIGRQIGELVNQVQQGAKVDVLKDKLLDVYEEKEHQAEIKKMDKSALMELGHNLTKGVPFATPVFDGAKEKDIEKWLKYAGHKSSGQVQ